MFSFLDYMVARKFINDCTKIDNKRDAGLVVPEDIIVYKDINYSNKNDNLLDVYRPKNVEGMLPVLVSIHGGGYVYGDKERYSFYTMLFAQNGFAVVNFNYSMAPKYRFPNALADTNDVFAWIASNKDQYGFDTENIVMIGDSAGAQLVSQYAVCASNPEYAKVMEFKIPDIKIKAVSLGCGFYKINTNYKEARSFERIYFTKNPVQFGEKIKPLDYINSNYPATFVLSSPGDFLYEHLEPMGDLLKSKGVDVETKSYGDKETYHVFFLDIRSDLAKECNNDQISFFRRHIG